MSGECPQKKYLRDKYHVDDKIIKNKMPQYKYSLNYIWQFQKNSVMFSWSHVCASWPQWYEWH